MDIKEITEKLHEFESVHPGYFPEHGGINFWPLIRYHFHLGFKSSSYFSKTKLRLTQPANFLSKKLIRSKYKKYVLSCRMKLGLDTKQDISLFISNHSEHRDNYDGFLFNRLIDPYLMKLKDKGENVLKVNFDSREKPGSYLEEAVDLSLNDLWYFHDRLFVNDFSLEEMEKEFHLNELESSIGIKLNREKLFNDVQSIRMFESFFLDLFRNSVVKKVFYACYYRIDYFGLTSACHSLNIDSIDIQHGKQGTFHPLYSHFGSIPTNGYKLLPTVFWNWGNESVRNILEYRNRVDIHLPFCGGNLYTAMYLNDTSWKKQLSIEQMSFLEKLKSFEKVIMIALQPPVKGASIPDYLLETINSSPKSWYWLFRQHPTYKEPMMQSIVSSNIETEFSTSLPLYPLLMHSNYCMTRWSTVGYEAEQFKNIVIINDPIGKVLFEKEIIDRRFHYVKNDQELKEVLNEGKLSTLEQSFISVSEADFENIYEFLYKKK